MNEVIYQKRGLAHVIDGQIYMHEGLKKWPRLHDRILEHERRHVQGHGIMEDIRQPWDWELFWFAITTPSCWRHFLPITYEDGVITYSLAMLVMWGLSALLFLCFAAAVLWTG